MHPISFKTSKVFFKPCSLAALILSWIDHTIRSSNFGHGHNGQVDPELAILKTRMVYHCPSLVSARFVNILLRKLTK